ncbi:hypothetical protein [Saccharothrix lopnurensis]|uniref:Pentapeptide repeat protein n=1 Tax=Saccharothrix lopnurensis TaxID=1670621 RepID=A0ABW1PH91_9PSEU
MPATARELFDAYWPAAAALLGLLALWRLTNRREPSHHQGPVWRSVVAWFAIALVIAAGTGAGLLWVFGWPALPRGVSFTATEVLDLLKIALAVVAGFGGVVALAVNYRRQRVTEAAHVLTLDQEQRERTKLFNERFSATSAQLGHEQAAVRVAGVYAMAGLADDWVAQRQTCLDVLCSYLRLPRDDEEQEGEVPRGKGEREVVAAIFRVLRARLGNPHTPGPWSDLDFDFTGIEFREADFSEITFQGRVVFDGAVFTGPHTSFERTVFRNTTLSCHGTVFTSAEVSFRDVLLDQATVEFVGAEFTKTSVDFTGSEIRGRTVYFFRTALTGAKITFRSGEVAGATVRFERSMVTDSELDFSDLRPDMARKRSFGFLVVDGTAVTRSRIDLRGIFVYETNAWFLDSTFTEVVVLADESVDRPWLRARRVKLVGTTLPAVAGAAASGGSGDAPQ